MTIQRRATRRTVVGPTAATIPRISVAASPLTINLVQSTNTTFTVAVTRTSYISAVTPSIDTLPSGISVSWNLSSSTGNTFVGTITATGGATLGTVPLTVRVSGPSVTSATDAITLVVLQGSSIIVSASPSTVTLVQGSTATITLTVARTNYNGNLTPYIAYLPTGVSVVWNPTSDLGNIFVGTLTATSSATIGSYTIAPEISGAGIEPTACTFSLTTSNSSYTTVAAKFYNYSGTASTQTVISGFPLAVGLLSSANFTAKKIALWVDGVEQACAWTALRGDHLDGTLRAVQIQTTHTFFGVDGAACEIRVGNVRTTTDLTATTMLDAHQAVCVVVVPTNPTYLCTTDLTLQSLIPRASWDSQMVGLFDTELSARTDVIATSSPRMKLGQSTYDNVRVYLAMWAMTADMKYFREAWLQSRAFVEDWIGNGASDGYNPESLSGDNAVRAEVHSQNKVGTMLAYYITGWRYNWLFANWWAQRGWNGKDGTRANAVHYYTGWIDNGRGNDNQAQGPRYNLIDPWAAVVGLRMHCTKPQATYNGGPRAVDYVNEVQWLVDSWIENRFGIRAINGESDWRAPLVGVSGLTCTGYHVVEVTSSTGTTFTGVLPGTANTLVPMAANAFTGYAWRPATETNYNVTATTAVSSIGQSITFTTSQTSSPPIGVGEKIMVPWLVGHFPAFQGGLTSSFLILLYTRVIKDSRIPAHIIAWADAIIAHTKSLAPGDDLYGVWSDQWGYDYNFEATAPSGYGFSGTLPMHANCVGFAYAYTGDATYRTWLDRYTRRENIQYSLSNVANDGATFKYFGETYGNVMDAPFWRKGAMPTLLPATTPTTPVTHSTLPSV